MSKQPRTTREDSELVDTESLLRETALKLRTLLRSVTANGAGEHEATVKGVARLSGAIATVCGELRQHAKGRLRTLGEFPIGDVVAYLRALPKQQRDQAFTAAFDADASEPLL
jgi:hypothetical protein